MQKKILITREIPAIAKKMLQAEDYLVTVNKKDRNWSKKELISLLRKESYAGVITLLTDKIDKEIFLASPETKIFSNYATGFDNLDVLEAEKKGVVITNSPAPLTSQAVAEHTIALMFSLTKNIVAGDKFIRAGKYKEWAPLQFLGGSLCRKTLGLVGSGRIGGKVAEFGANFGMRIIYTDPIKNENIEKRHGAIRINSLEEMLKEADFVSLHVPLLPSTKHLINEKTLRLMKPTAYLINTSRGPVVDEKALEKALKEKVIAGAGLDVFEFEPKISRGLLQLHNIILTPHIASALKEAREQMAKIAAQNIIDFFVDRELKNKVTK